MVPADAGDPLLRPVERPVGREVSAVLVAVGVPDHHRLLAAAGRQVGAVGLQREELGQHGRRLVEIVERLEERRHREPGGAAGPAGEDEDGQHVRGRARHRDHERAEELGPVHAAGPGEQPEQRPRLPSRIVEPVRLGGRGRRRGGGEERLECAGPFGVRRPRGRRRPCPRRRRSWSSVPARRPASSRRSRRAAWRPNRSICVRTVRSRSSARGAGTAAAMRSSGPASASTWACARCGRVSRSRARHVLGGGGPEIRGQEGQHDAVGLVAVAPLQVRGALGKGAPARQPCREPGGERQTPVAHAEAAARDPEARDGAARRRGPGASRSVSAVTAAVTYGFPSRSPPIHEPSPSHRRGTVRPG